MPRLAFTADLHHDVPRSRAAAEALAERYNRELDDFDALLIVGDAATSDGDALERCLGLFRDDRPRLFVPGNHELWSKHQRIPAEQLLADVLPERVTAAGWHWLLGSPYRLGQSAIVGTPGWYDYAFAASRLGLPERFYAAKSSPAASGEALAPEADDVPEHARGFFARWNDGRFIEGIGDDAAFCRRRVREFELDLISVADAEHVVAAVHVCPTAELLPAVPPGPIPDRALKYAFVRAYLGSPRFGEVAERHDNVRHLVCGHSHVRREQRTDRFHGINVGSTYTEKHLVVLELP